jgi:hypothetical protein
MILKWWRMCLHSHLRKWWLGRCFFVEFWFSRDFEVWGFFCMFVLFWWYLYLNSALWLLGRHSYSWDIPPALKFRIVRWQGIFPCQSFNFQSPILLTVRIDLNWTVFMTFPKFDSGFSVIFLLQKLQHRKSLVKLRITPFIIDNLNPQGRDGPSGL